MRAGCHLLRFAEDSASIVPFRSRVRYCDCTQVDHVLQTKELQQERKGTSALLLLAPKLPIQLVSGANYTSFQVRTTRR